jgi:hypothetical protein
MACLGLDLDRRRRGGAGLRWRLRPLGAPWGAFRGEGLPTSPTAEKCISGLLMSTCRFRLGPPKRASLSLG